MISNRIKKAAILLGKNSTLAKQKISYRAIKKAFLNPGNAFSVL